VADRSYNKPDRKEGASGKADAGDGQLLTRMPPSPSDEATVSPPGLLRPWTLSLLVSLQMPIALDVAVDPHPLSARAGRSLLVLVEPCDLSVRGLVEPARRLAARLS